MTAEVAILNKQGVALAADSAVTIGGQKIFNSVNKLFALSKHHPVGIMAYNRADIMGVPVETVIKEYRRRKDGDGQALLENYATDFENFLREDESIFNAEARQQDLDDAVGSFFGYLRDRIQDRLLEVAIDWGHPTRDEARPIVREEIDALAANVKRAEPLASKVPVKAGKRLNEEVSDAVEANVHEFRTLFPMSKGTVEKLARAARTQINKKIHFGAYTGIVIAGFGDEEVFPRLRAFEYHFSTVGLHKVMRGQPIDIDDRLTAMIEAFGQADVMTIWMEGRHRLYDNLVAEFIESFSRDQVERLNSANVLPQKYVPVIKGILDNLSTDLLEQLRDSSRELFIDPTLSIVSHMPKKELAQLAEALVNLTSLKRKSSTDLETVGGPTDVAIISKGDGLVWMARKHYFDAKYNPDFFVRTGGDK